MNYTEKKSFNKTLFIFRRDLRIEDNLGLIKAAKESLSIIPCFIFDPRQLEKNPYKSENAVQFMLESLFDLEQHIKGANGKLYFFHGNPKDIVKQLIKQEQLDAIFCNKDYTPFSIKRDEEIKKICYEYNIHFEHCADALLNEPENIKTGKGTGYNKFTPFYKHCSSTFSVLKPEKFNLISWHTKKIAHEKNADIFKHFLDSINPDIKIHGGTTQADTILKKLAQYKEYAKRHDFPALDSTTHLSAHLKFGTISVRQTYHAIVKYLGISHPLIRQLYWRDFFYHVTYNNPHVFGHAFYKKYDNLWWENNKQKFASWRQGKTGFPIVDAGMRELNTTGYMHNRVRMIVASFLVKDLHIDWRWGEKYFAQKLVDYDPALNNGNWQWCASTGCDAQPYFRIFNPWLQQKKFDPECKYIKKWISELKDINCKTIHTLYKNSVSVKNYPKPIADHAKESVLTKNIFKKISFKK